LLPRLDGASKSSGASPRPWRPAAASSTIPTPQPAGSSLTAVATVSASAPGRMAPPARARTP